MINDFADSFIFLEINVNRTIKVKTSRTDSEFCKTTKGETVATVKAENKTS